MMSQSRLWTREHRPGPCCHENRLESARPWHERGCLQRYGIEVTG